MTAAVLRNELKSCIDTMPERRLAALKPLLFELATPAYTVETDLTAEELAIIEKGMQDYREHPETFVNLESIL
ncbi:hypothetical protein FACS189483_09080 [Spirochaetia bacterium]|nr:hypothetical protein FACS189483_09080 [Spirochaetia bacterium]